jgi:hypothetical protein
LALAARLRELFDEGMTLEAATRIVALQDELSLTREQLSAARDQLGVSGPGSSTPPATSSPSPARGWPTWRRATTRGPRRRRRADTAQ